MQRFNPGDLEKLEKYLANIGFTPSVIKTHCEDDLLPHLSLTIGGRGSLEALNTLLRTGPFLVLDMQTRPAADGHTVRLKLTSRRAAPEMGDEAPVYVAFEPEMGE